MLGFFGYVFRPWEGVELFMGLEHTTILNVVPIISFHAKVNFTFNIYISLILKSKYIFGLTPHWNILCYWV